MLLMSYKPCRLIYDGNKTARDCEKVSQHIPRPEKRKGLGVQKSLNQKKRSLSRCETRRNSKNIPNISFDLCGLEHILGKGFFEQFSGLETERPV